MHCNLKEKEHLKRWEKKKDYFNHFIYQWDLNGYEGYKNLKIFFYHSDPAIHSLLTKSEEF